MTGNCTSQQRFLPVQKAASSHCGHAGLQSWLARAHQILSRGLLADVADGVVEAAEEQQGGGEVIDNPEAVEAVDNPDGYLAEEDAAGTEAVPHQETEGVKA